MGLSFLRQISGKGASAGTTTVRSERIHAVAGRELPLRVFENPRAKRLTLRIEAGGRGLRITVPPGLPEREVLSFLNRHEGWIESRIAKLPDQPGVRAGIKIPLRGVPHKIVHQPGRGRYPPRRADSGRDAVQQTARWWCCHQTRPKLNHS